MLSAKNLELTSFWLLSFRAVIKSRVRAIFEDKITKNAAGLTLRTPAMDKLLRKNWGVGRGLSVFFFFEVKIKRER